MADDDVGLKFADKRAQRAERPQPSMIERDGMSRNGAALRCFENCGFIGRRELHIVTACAQTFRLVEDADFLSAPALGGLGMKDFHAFAPVARTRSCNASMRS